MKPSKKELEKMDYSIYDQNIQVCDMGEYIREVVLKYGINVSVFRACATILDGLPPGKRRMLYTMYELGATADKPRRKANELLGPVSKLHPHGDLSINKTFHNEIKEWETNAPLFDCQGNTGSLTGQRAAAVRYLDTRLSKYAMKCFFDEFDPDVVDMVESNTRTTLEPVYIPSRYPNFLLSLTTGIAWGNSMSIPPFNLIEVFRLTQALIKNPQMTKVYLYPDSPRGYDIIENDDIIEICDSGKGTIKIQARIDYYEQDGVRYLEVTGFPEQTTMDPIMQKISNMVLNKELNGVENLADKTQLSDVKFWIILKKDADPDFIKDMIYRKTALRSYVSLEMNFAARTSMQHLGIKDSLLVWIENRIDMKQRIYTKKLSKLQEKLHELEGVISVLSPENVDEVIGIIKNAENDADSIAKLCNRFGTTSYQAAIINDIRLNKISKSSRAKFLEDFDKTMAEAREVQDIVTSRERIKDIICDELEEGIKLFGKPRACRIISKDALKPPVHSFNVIVTKRFIKKISVNANTVGALESTDEVLAAFTNVPETRQIYVVDDTGKCYCIPITKLKPNDLVSKGTELKSLVNVKGTPIRAFMSGEDINQEKNTMIMFTSSGIIKRSPVDQYLKNRSELQGILLNKDDTVCHMTIHSADENNDFALIYTDNGYGIALNLNDIAITDRLTKGSNYLKLDDNDNVRGVCDYNTNNDNQILVVTTKGYVKVCELDEIFKTSKRRTAMIKLANLNDGDTIFKIIPLVNIPGNTITVILQSGTRQTLNINEVPRTTRIGKGTKMIQVKRGDAIIKIK